MVLPSGSAFGTLPIELLYVIKSFMSESDLRSNVCFYRADPLFAALYGKEEEVRRYWEKLCAVNGIGCIADEDPHAYADFWRDVAFDSIDRDGWCPHPQCGEQQLISNRREYANSQARTVAYSGVYPSCNQAVPFLGFRKEAAEHASSALEDVYIIEGETKQIARNANGLTVADFMACMHFELDGKLSAPSIKQLIHDMRYGTFDMQSVREDPGIVWQSFRLNLPAIIKEGMSRRQFFHIL
ncbi:hypothetical protein K474DRAFT_1709093 [Panus rudis PR-1116 ss-1]|nr:hypothetical protein K474DRAFT_1709093 [Panus rudis PR-1116 ss-1]